MTRQSKPVPVVVVSAIGAVRGRTRNRKASKALLALLRSCPVDLSRIVIRDRSVPRTFDLG